jgi:Protein of unknown function (DUF3014)
MVESRNDIPPASEYELRKAPEEPPPLPPPQRNVGVWIAIAVLIVAAAVAVYIVFGRRQPPAPVSTTTAPVQAPPQAIKPLGGNAPQIDLPPLDASDALVRELAAQLSSNPRVAAWLATDGLIRSFTVIFTNIAEGRTPAVHLRMFRPSESFQVTQAADGFHVDPRSYHRYDALTAAAASIDPAGAARLYSMLKPRIEEAYQELGAPQGSFDRALEHAIVMLLQTPIVDEAVRVQPHGVVYVFADPALEALTPAQKQLLRAGPANVRTIQSSLRAVALALGIPSDRLPIPKN